MENEIWDAADKTIKEFEVLEGKTSDVHIDAILKELSDEKDFELKLTEIEVQSGSLAVTWCVSPEIINHPQFKEMYVLLATGPMEPNGHKAEWRGYAKLSDLVAYVTFYRPGLNRIYAKLVTHWDVKQFMSFNRSVDYPWEGEEDLSKHEYKFREDGFCNQDHIDVDIPGECFAKEPSKIEKVWVNWLWETQAKDQCDFRKRRVFAYSMQPVIFLALWLFRICAAFFFLAFGCKKIGWAPIYHPLSYCTEDVWDGIDGNWLVVKKWGDYDSILVPAPILLISSMVLGICVTKSFLGILFGLVGLLGLIILGVLGWLLASYLAKEKVVDDSFDKELLLCSSELKIKRIADLPKKKRSIKLRFNGLKSMVCRPFSR